MCQYQMMRASSNSLEGIHVNQEESILVRPRLQQALADVVEGPPLGCELPKLTGIVLEDDEVAALRITAAENSIRVTLVTVNGQHVECPQ